MTVKTLAHNITGITGLLDVTLTESYDSAVSQAIITCYTTTKDVGDSINFNLGFSGNTGKVFTGYVRQLQKELPGATTKIVCEDELSKAIDFFIAADDPQNPYRRNNISTETLVTELLNMADITDINVDLPFEVTWATGSVPVEFNLITVYDAVKQILDVPAFHVFCDRNGTVQVISRRPYDETGSEPSSFSFNSANNEILSISYDKSTDRLRNRIVVYGSTGISASAEAESPYLPSGFRKTAVIATPIVTSNSIAQEGADRNLEMLNRLTESVTMTVEGDWNVKPRLFATVTDSYTGVSGKWFIFRVEHSFSKNAGYKQTITLTR